MGRTGLSGLPEALLTAVTAVARIVFEVKFLWIVAVIIGLSLIIF
jgi:hypothetical protein